MVNFARAEPIKWAPYRQGPEITFTLSNSLYSGVGIKNYQLGLSISNDTSADPSLRMNRSPEEITESDSEGSDPANFTKSGIDALGAKSPPASSLPSTESDGGASPVGDTENSDWEMWRSNPWTCAVTPFEPAKIASSFVCLTVNSCNDFLASSTDISEMSLLLVKRLVSFKRDTRQTLWD